MMSEIVTLPLPSKSAQGQGRGVGVGVMVGVFVIVGVGVIVGVLVAVRVGVAVGAMIDVVSWAALFRVSICSAAKFGRRSTKIVAVTVVFAATFTRPVIVVVAMSPAWKM